MGSAAPSPSLPPARFWSLDVLRGVCATMVFLSHWLLWTDFAPRTSAESLFHAFGQWLCDAMRVLTWPTGGHHPAVIGFFVLSGFCIHYPFERRQRAGGAHPDWADYFRRRFVRIAPVYWTACLLGLALVAAEAFHPTGDALLTFHARGSAMDIAARVTGVGALYPREILAGNYTLTTVSTEMLMYALYPLFWRAASRGAWGALGALFVAAQIGSVLSLRFFSPYWVFNSLFMLGIFWYAGALAAHLYLTRGARLAGGWLVVAWLAFLGLKALSPFPGLNLLKQAAWGGVFTLGLFGAVRYEETHPAAGTTRVMKLLRRLGTVSYSLYAVHTPIVMLTSWALLSFGLRSYGLQLAASLMAVFAATFAVHRWVEHAFYRPRSEAPSLEQPPSRAPAVSRT